MHAVSYRQISEAAGLGNNAALHMVNAAAVEDRRLLRSHVAEGLTCKYLTDLKLIGALE